MSLTAKNLRVFYGKRLTVDLPDLTAGAGEILTILGPNGSGKSTLLKALAGVTPTEGRVALQGGAIPSGALGYMPQDSGPFSGLTVLEIVLLGRLGRLGARITPDDLAAAEAALDQLGLLALTDRPVGGLSGGQRQLVFLAQTLIKQPQILLLDEPTSALDLRHQLTVLDTVRRITRAQGLVTVIVLHDLTAAARFGDRTALLKEGRLWQIGPPAEVLTPASLAMLYGIETEILTDSAGHQVVVPLRAQTLERNSPCA